MASRSRGRADPVADAAALLGISASSDANTVKAAYRRAAQLYHPDTGTAPEASDEHMAAISAAYEVMKQAVHDQQWGTSSSAIGAGLQAPPRRITHETG